MADFDPEDLQRLYEGWPSDRLLKAATEDAPEFHPLAVPIMRRVLLARGIDPDAADAPQQAVGAESAGRRHARLKRIRGWLFVFVLFVVVQSLAFLAHLLQLLGGGEWRITLTALPLFVMGVYGIYCVHLLTLHRRKAREATWLWVLLSAAFGLVLNVASSLGFAATTPNGFPVATAPISLLFLSRSKRVAAIYGRLSARSEPTPAPAPPTEPPRHVKAEQEIARAIETPRRDDAAQLAREDRIFELLNELLLEEIGEEEWEPFFDRHHMDDDLRAELRSRLRALDDVVPVPTLAFTVPEDGADLLVGAVVGGRYQIESLLPVQGGMGVVYKAARVGDDLTRPVAIKVLPRGLNTDALLRRFQRERRIQGQLQHPSIVTVFDVGALPDGRPYYVMEWIARGMPLDTYCAHHHLGVEARLRLFQRVCEAVHYAHQQGVVHRDLKPGNVLVTADGLPKLLDFGVAKLIDDDDETTLTAALERLGTPDYMSPEQADGATITAQSDQYSLGVMLYELLTGRRPYDLGAAAWRAIQRAIRETDISRPSQMAAGHPATPVPARQLRGDLDDIVMSTLRTEPERRYPSIAHLRDDIERWLTHQPIAARAPSARYVAVRLVRRHRAATAVAATALVTAVAVVSLLIVTNRATADALSRAERAERDVREALNRQVAGEAMRLVGDGMRLAAIDPDRSGAAFASALKLDAGNTYAASRLMSALSDVADPLPLGGSISAAKLDQQGVYAAVAGGRAVDVRRTSDGVSIGVVEHQADVIALAWFPDRARLVSGDVHGVVRWTDVTPAGTLVAGAAVREPAPISSIATAADGHAVYVAAGGELTEWTADGQRHATVYRSAGGWISSTGCDGSRAVVESGVTATLVDTRQQRVLLVLPDGAVPTILGCRYLASSVEGRTTLFELADGKRVTRIDDAMAVAWSASSGRLFVAGEAAIRAQYFPASNRTDVPRFKGSEHYSALDVDASGQRLLSFTREGAVVWRLARSWAVGSRQWLLAPAATGGTNVQLWTIEFASDDTIAVYSDRKYSFRVTGELLPNIESGNSAPGFESEWSRTLANGDQATVEAGEVTLKHSDGTTSRQRLPATAVTMSADGELIVVKESIETPRTIYTSRGRVVSPEHRTTFSVLDLRTLLPLYEWKVPDNCLHEGLGAALSPRSNAVAFACDRSDMKTTLLTYVNLPRPEGFDVATLLQDAARAFGDDSAGLAKAPAPDPTPSPEPPSLPLPAGLDPWPSSTDPRSRAVAPALRWAGENCGGPEPLRFDAMVGTVSGDGDIYCPVVMTLGGVVQVGGGGSADARHLHAFDLNGDGRSEVIWWMNVGGNNTTLYDATVQALRVPEGLRGPVDTEDILSLGGGSTYVLVTKKSYAGVGTADFIDADGDGYREIACIANADETKTQPVHGWRWPKGSLGPVEDPRVKCTPLPAGPRVRMTVDRSGASIR